MKRHLMPYYFILMWSGFTACQPGDKPRTQTADQPADSLSASISTDTLNEHNSDVQAHLNQLKDEWMSVPNPLVARYTGSEFGDYLHLTFKDAQGRTYDFGNGKNSLGQMLLYGDDFISNPEYVGKKFRISWDWKKSSFYCCEGEMNTVEAQVPSIVGVELVP